MTGRNLCLDTPHATLVAPILAIAYATNADAVADSYFQLGGNFFAFCSQQEGLSEPAQPLPGKTCCDASPRYFEPLQYIHPP